MSEQKYLKDISDIKNLMTKSSRFISLSGWAGIMAGIYALLGGVIAYYLVSQSGRDYLILDGYVFKLILADLCCIALFSVVTAIYITTKKAKQDGVSIWDATTKKLLGHFLVPLVTGGIYILIILGQQKYGQTGALMLIFYGLALVSASAHSIGHIKYLGYVEIVLGLICAIVPGYGFWIWMLGFGVLHIVYGVIMLLKEKR